MIENQASAIIAHLQKMLKTLQDPEPVPEAQVQADAMMFQAMMRGMLAHKGFTQEQSLEIATLLTELIRVGEQLTGPVNVPFEELQEVAKSFRVPPPSDN